jgi:hypothetical protein
MRTVFVKPNLPFLPAILATALPNPPKCLQVRSSFLPVGVLQQQFGLCAFDLDVILIALAPELDRRYEQIYAYLQQDGRSCSTQR